MAAGFASTPMDAIAKAARISKGTLYARYATKEALLRVVLKEQKAVWDAGAARRRGPMPDDFKQRVQLLARGILDSLALNEIQEFYRLIRGASVPAQSLARTLLEGSYRQVIQDLAAEFVRGMILQEVAGV